jgi:hypothetical protein
LLSACGTGAVSRASSDAIGNLLGVRVILTVRITLTCFTSIEVSRGLALTPGGR